jgi:hypothetical protein
MVNFMREIKCLSQKFDNLTNFIGEILYFFLLAAWPVLAMCQGQ